MNTSWAERIKSIEDLSIEKITEIEFFPFLIIMVISLLSSLFISLLYRSFYQSRATGSSVNRSFPLLGLSVTAIFITIQFSLPLSLGLLGALSIVRFRTAIKEPEEIGFIMLVIASSLCCATFNMLFLGILLSVAVSALLSVKFGRRLFKGRMNDGMVIITLPTSEYRVKGEKLMTFLEDLLPKGRIDSISEDQDESTISYSFIRLKKETLLILQNDLRMISDKAISNIFFNCSREI